MSCGCGGRCGTCGCCHHCRQSQYIIKIGHIIVQPLWAFLSTSHRHSALTLQTWFSTLRETQLCCRYNVWASVVASQNIVMRPIVHLTLPPLMSRVWWRGPGPLRGGAARLRGGCGRQQILRQLRPGTRGTETCTEQCTGVR